MQGSLVQRTHTQFLFSIFMKYNYFDIVHSGNIEGIRKAFKKFARRHGLKPDEVGRRESRTMDYKVDFPNKEQRIAEVRKRYGTPAYVKRKYCEKLS
tara:strand:- start:38495 stop:38785 length:291 start_codon:yes stop_codon:yes gene_type:complete